MVKRLGWTLRDGYVVAGRNTRHFFRQPQLLIFSTIQPIMFVLLFSFVFGGAISGSLPAGVSYKDFLLPGIFIQSTSFRATQTAIGLSEDMKRGVIDRFRSMPMARSAVLAGRTLADLLRTLFVVVLMIIVGYAIGFRFEEGIPSAIGCVMVVAAFGFALSWIFAYVGLVAKGPGGGAVGGLRRDLPAGVRKLDLRPHRHHARLASGDRQREPGDGGGQRRASTGDRRRRVEPALAGDRLGDRHPARVRPALRAQVPPPAVVAAEPPPPSRFVRVVLANVHGML